ncbi:radical SAM protein [Desulfobacula phenolica]|nr:radical SAM protein [Desulfobacula phenolica]
MTIEKKKSFYFQSERFQDVNLEISNICNFNCWFCPRGAMTRPLGKMNFENFKKIIGNLKESDVISNIKIAGIGEPTLHPQLIKMVRYIKENTNFRVHLTTNASRFQDEDFRKMLLHAKIDKITISLRISNFSWSGNSVPTYLKEESYSDSVIKFINEKYESNSLSEVEIAFFKSSYYCRYIVGKKNDEYIDTKKLNAFIKKIGQKLNITIPSYDEFTDNIKSKLQYYIEIPITPGLIFRFDALNSWTTVVDRYRDKKNCYPAKYGACMGLLDHFAVFWNGDVSTCCLDFDVRNKLGNALEENIKKILYSHRAMRVAHELRRKRMPTKTCQICRGGKTRLEKLVNIVGTITQIK